MSKQLSLKRKRELAADLQAGITESKAVAKYRTSKGTVGRVRRDVHRYLNLDVDALGEDRKRELKVRTDGLDAQMVNFLHLSREQNLIVTGPVLQSVATSFAKKMVPPLDGFVASNGWLEKFRIRNKVVCKVLQGERASAPIAVADEFKASLPDLLAPYEARNIFNADEIGLFWEATGRKSLLLADDDPPGAKVSKKRMTILLVAAMNGNLEKILVINTALKPRAFKKIKNDLSRLPTCMIWRATKKGWVNSKVFQDWLLEFNARMRSQSREVLLALDNFSGHALGVDLCEENLTNMNIVWLPPNCTSIVQPVDQGPLQKISSRVSGQDVDHRQGPQKRIGRASRMPVDRPSLELVERHSDGDALLRKGWLPSRESCSCSGSRCRGRGVPGRQRRGGAAARRRGSCRESKHSG